MENASFYSDSYTGVRMIPILAIHQWQVALAQSAADDASSVDSTCGTNVGEL